MKTQIDIKSALLGLGAGILVMLVIAAASPTVPANHPAIEYKIEMVQYGRQESIAALQSYLDRLGKDGWQLVHYESHVGQFRVIMSRGKQ
jgi:hypothetical protein